MAKGSILSTVSRIAAVLTLICTLVAALLSFVYSATNDQYEQNMLNAKREAIASLYGLDEVDTESLSVAGDAVKELYLVSANGRVLGCCANVKSVGFGGEIDMMVAADADGKLRGVRIVTMSETPGLGSRVGEQDYLGQYEGIDVVDVAIGNATLDEQVDAISGATISSKAVKNGVNLALEEIQRYYGIVTGFGTNEGGDSE